MENQNLPKIEESTFLEKEYDLESIGIDKCTLCIEEDIIYILSKQGQFNITSINDFKLHQNNYILTNEDKESLIINLEQFEIIVQILKDNKI